MNHCLLVGSGFGSLALGALLAKSGVRVTVLEQADDIGGHARTIRAGEFRFAAGPRYLWGFGAGEPGQLLLEECGISKQVCFCPLDADGFEHVYLGGDTLLRVPIGLKRFSDSLKSWFPDQHAEIDAFFRLMRYGRDFVRFVTDRELNLEPFRVSGRRYCLSTIRRLLFSARFLRLTRWTLEDAFDATRIRPEVRRILYAHGMIFALPSDQIAFLAYAGGTSCYHEGAYFPKGGMAALCDALRQVIQGNCGEILTNAEVHKVQVGRNMAIESVVTTNGETHTADQFVCNIDPRSFMQFTEPQHWKSRPPLDYPYSNGLSSVFLGLSDDTVTKKCFGPWNVWHLASNADNSVAYDAPPFENPSYMYLNCPSAVAGPEGNCKPGKATLTAFVPASYLRHRELNDSSPTEYRRQKQDHLAVILRSIEENYAPGLRNCLEVTEYHTPLDTASMLKSPHGNVYGLKLTPKGILRKPAHSSGLPNLHFLSAYVTLPGISPLAHGSLLLWKTLLGHVR